MDSNVEAALPFHPRSGDQLARRTAGNRVAYVYSDDIVIAVNAALATRRPLLLRGAPGSGKSTLARDVALALGREYLDQTITSRTTARDLLWEFDAVARLSEVSDLEAVRDRSRYVRPGILWSAFEPVGEAPNGCVVLVDEIDKADPDVPNDLLVPLGEDRFKVTDVRPEREVQRRRDVLVVITSNGERELPPAFLRRCVALELVDPSVDRGRLMEIARQHFRQFLATDATPRIFNESVVDAIVVRVQQLTNKLAPTTRRPGTAEILDALRAALLLRILPGDADWERLTSVVLFKESGGLSEKKPKNL
jgi:MoxR-like ATPase